jgi:hypothetical protein
MVDPERRIKNTVLCGPGYATVASRRVRHQAASRTATSNRFAEDEGITVNRSAGELTKPPKWPLWTASLAPGRPQNTAGDVADDPRRRKATSGRSSIMIGLAEPDLDLLAELEKRCTEQRKCRKEKYGSAVYVLQPDESE